MHGMPLLETAARLRRRQLPLLIKEHCQLRTNETASSKPLGGPHEF